MKSHDVMMMTAIALQKDPTIVLGLISPIIRDRAQALIDFSAAIRKHAPDMDAALKLTEAQRAVVAAAKKLGITQRPEDSRDLLALRDALQQLKQAEEQP